MPETYNFQAEFECKRGHLHDPHVRDLAWLLDSPNLLDATAPQWQGKIASLFGNQGEEIDAWLTALDQAPQQLHALIASHAFNRLGRYSELLLAHFLRDRGVLYAHGVQVRADKNDTIGEFDFLVYRPNSAGLPELHHWEFATKFYLLEANSEDRNADFLVGPNLADTLGAKMRKILDRQLALSRHPAAAALLPGPIDNAQALVKGWLFYHPSDHFSAQEMARNGVNLAHCRGYWRVFDEIDELSGDCFAILPRLSWMAPARLSVVDCLSRLAMADVLKAHFANDDQPVMVATLRAQGEFAVEVERGFIVPNDWRQRASAFVRHA
jgi:hypothetical protein